MIPVEKSINVVTRLKSALQQQCIQNNGIPQKIINNMFAWECVSISDVRHLKLVNFQTQKGIKSNEALIEVKKEIICMITSSPKQIDILNIFNKLIKEMKKLQLTKIALRSNDPIFNHISKSIFKQTFNDFQNENSKKSSIQINPKYALRILIFNPPKEIKDGHFHPSVVIMVLKELSIN